MSHLVPQDEKPESQTISVWSKFVLLFLEFPEPQNFKMLWYGNDDKDTHLQEMGLAGLSAGMNGQKVRRNPRLCT